MSRVLIVGGAGYVGSAVTDFLLTAGHDVRVYDCLLWEDEFRKPVAFMRGDIRDHDRLAPHLAWADAVIWLAALVADGACAMYPDLATDLNDRAVAWLAHVYHGRIIFPSSSLVYALTGALLTEDAPIHPTTAYTQTKVAAEQHLAGRALIVRLATLFGVADAYARPRFDLVTNLLTMRAATEGRMTMIGGTQSRGFLHVRDVARVMVDHVGTPVVGTYNLHAENATILELAERIRTHISTAVIERREADTIATGDVRLVSDRARAELGFRPRFTLDQGIHEIHELVMSGRLRDAGSARYSNERFLRASPLTDHFLRRVIPA